MMLMLVVVLVLVLVLVVVLVLVLVRLQVRSGTHLNDVEATAELDQLGRMTLGGVAVAELAVRVLPEGEDLTLVFLLLVDVSLRLRLVGRVVRAAGRASW